MNLTVGESSLYLHKLLTKLHAYRDIEVVVAPSMIALQPLSLQVDRRKIKLACQNVFYKDYGAYTGEVSVAQVRSLANYVLVGHSERRYIFKETDQDIKRKVAAVLRAGMTPVLCIGEPNPSARSEKPPTSSATNCLAVLPTSRKKKSQKSSSPMNPSGPSLATAPLASPRPSMSPTSSN